MGTGLKRELGVVAATSIVVGNIVGTGIFLSPTSMALVSNPKASIIAWIITAIGSLFIALSFANLGTAIPETGGPVVYARKAFGEFASFLVAWSYWIGMWVGNAAIITGIMSYLSYFVPQLTNTPMLSFLTSSAILWGLTFINIKGSKEAGIFTTVTTFLKIAILLVFIVVAGIHFNPDNLNTVSSESVNSLSTVPAAIAIALWAFAGIESAAISGGEIKNPQKTIRQSTIYGTLIAAFVYIGISIVAMGAVPQSFLANSNAPLADIINSTTNSKWGGHFIAFGALISGLGSAAGGILVTARIAYAAGEDKIFPKSFAKVHNKFKTPYMALIINAFFANILLIMNYMNSLTEAFNFMILLATLSYLPAYAFTACAEILLLYKKDNKFNIFNFIKSTIFSLLAFAYSIYAIYGTGAQVVMYGFILMLLGIPFYVYMKIKNSSH